MAKMDITSRLISITDAAAKLGYGNGSTLRRMAADGRITGAVKIGKSWVLPLAWVEEKAKASAPVKGWPRGEGTRNK
jgi:hypothetical protein